MKKVLLAGFALLFSFPTFADELPGCDDESVIETIGEIVDEQATKEKNNNTFIDLRFIIETAYNKKKAIRVCHGTLTTENGQESLSYKIAWDDPKHEYFYVEIQ